MSGFLLHLLRHGETEGAGTLTGHRDAAPLPGGTAACLVRGLPLPVDRVVSSDLQRTVRPARDIATFRGLPHRIDPRWRELDFGQWEGCDPAVLPADAIGAFWTDPDAAPPPGGESWSDLCARIGAALEEIDRPTLVITHAGAIRAALHHLLGFDYRQGWAVALPHAALVTLRVWQGEARSAQLVGLTGEGP